MTWIIVASVIATLVGGLLALNFATPEKKLQHIPKHLYDVADPQFKREMSVLLGPAILPGNKVDVLQNGHEIFPAMLAAIRAAKRTITFETYIYWSGEIGREFSEALSERARAGVEVRVTIDWGGSLKMDHALVDTMTEAGVEVHRYRPLAWYNLHRINNRTHRKLLVIDGRIGFTGGVGVADQWMGDAQDPEHWRDTHYRIEGPVVAQVQTAFNDNWIKSTGRVVNGADYYPALTPAGDSDAQLFVASPSGGSESMHLMYLVAIAAASTSIDLAAAYFVPDALITRALLEARTRGVRIRVLLPGPHIDAISVRLASKASWEPLLQAGIEIHEYQTTMLHTKLLIVDGLLVSVGSTNFDIRSFRLNDEASLNVYDRTLAARMTTVFERDLQQAQAYSLERWRARPLREKLAEKLVIPIRSQV
ncbi:MULTISPECIES: phospholipase D-like domain-containing protein [Xanthomonas]|uniref:phospholipase D-like domain-containing protein n=1 Tax=Xanthomonas TaxID=338 RepID=UPI000D464467|nr:MULTISPECIES: phospholipase D-like domain-containing protein [Xanthomonas]MEA9761311.1 phospholipase D-like domain-containing protein [Xanthomonas campestris pv. raphani]MEB2183772.1 phospholipase D-like domain-containing protein [Xanthomonas campestris pv. campestris]WDK79175.1 cardiolipin synthase B [Xanthomonas campestris pv. campestris]WDL50129.1 cardiolipin synthase B [Xanthomonas campestris pv. campestris]WDL54501.1 cardiolipin synthase B [Xanthomonas campestris pv. campestris]